MRIGVLMGMQTPRIANAHSQSHQPGTEQMQDQAHATGKTSHKPWTKIDGWNPIRSHDTSQRAHDHKPDPRLVRQFARHPYAPRSPRGYAKVPLLLTQIHVTTSSDFFLLLSC